MGLSRYGANVHPIAPFRHSWLWNLVERVWMLTLYFGSLILDFSSLDFVFDSGSMAESFEFLLTNDILKNGAFVFIVKNAW